jgi:hypothetical protein
MCASSLGVAAAVIEAHGIERTAAPGTRNRTQSGPASIASHPTTTASTYFSMAAYTMFRITVI